MRPWEILGWNSGKAIRRSCWGPGEHVVVDQSGNWMNNTVVYPWDEVAVTLLEESDWEPYAAAKRKKKVMFWRPIFQTDSSDYYIDPGWHTNRQRWADEFDIVGWESREVEVEE